MKCINVFYGGTPSYFLAATCLSTVGYLKFEAINSMKIGVEEDTGRHGPRRGD
jgi:hypothetical protein